MPDEILNPVDAGAENVVDSQQVEQAEVQVESESVNEEVTPSQIEKPVQSKEDNAQYAAVRREAEAKTRDKMISEMYGDSHNIHTYSDYQKAVEQEAERTRRAELEENGVDPSIIEKYVNNHPEVKKSKEVLTQYEQQKKQADEYGDFLKYFKDENNREFSPESDKLPDEVWLMTSEKNRDGTPNTKRKTLTDAYAYHDSRQLRAKLKAFETNQANAQSSPGSLTGNGDNKNTTLTPEIIDSMTDKERMARWPEIKKVLGMK